jgi:hypothetical protein
MRGTTLVLASVVFSCVSKVAFSQAMDGNLIGAVSDQTGAAVPNANLEIENAATGVKLATPTNAVGQYRFNNLLPGRYHLKVTAPGFNITTLQNILVELNKTATANITLHLGVVATQVEVWDAGALIDTTTAQVTSTYTSREAIDTPASALPLGVLNLSLMSAGVASSGGIGLGDGPSVGGQRPRNNNFNVEGVDNNRKDVTGHNVDIPNEAVAEFSMLQNQYSAEFGNGSGGQFNTVIRGGGNNVHGSLYEYFQNRNLNGVDESAARQGIRSNPRFDQNTLGGSVGGPIRKNKLFYYGLFQYNPLGQAGTPSSAILSPTAAGYSQLTAIPGVSQTNLSVLKQYLAPAPSATTTTLVSGAEIPIGILPITKPSYTNTYSWLVSADYNISNSDQIRGRYANVRTSGFSETTLPDLPAFFLGRNTRQHLFTFSEYHNFSPNLLNEFRIGYNRYNDVIPAGSFAFPGLDVFPNVTIEDDLNVQLGPYDGAPQSTVINTYQLIDNVVWTRGAHSMKFGWEGRKYIAPQFFTQRVRGDYNYKTLERYVLDLSPDVLGERNVGAAPYSGNQINTSAFFTDAFRLRPNLTLTLGVRYEYKGVPEGDKLQALNAISSVPGLIEFRKPTAQTTNFVPRVGLAYSPGTTGRTSIRAGFGMSYDKYFDNLGLNSKPPQLESTVDVNPSQTSVNFLANGGIRPDARPQSFANAQEARDATSAFIVDQKLPYSIQWNAGVQRVIKEGYTLEVRYLGTRGVHLPTQSRINIQSVVTPTRFLPTYLQAPSQATLTGLPYTLGNLQEIDLVLPQWAPYFDNSNITSFPYRGNSSYHGLATELTRRFTRGLLFRGAYTWSHNIDDSTADLFSTLLAPRRPEDFQNMNKERSTSFLDRRHRFTFSWVWDTPWLNTSDNWLMKNIIGNFTLSGTYTYESPQFATVQSGLDSNLNGDSAGDRAIVNINGARNMGTGVNPIDRNGNIVAAGSPNIVAYVARNPGAQYIVAGLGALTNAGRMTIPTRPINNFDLAVKKAFSVREGMRLEFGAQFFNAFNHPQFVPGYINNVQFHESRNTNNNLIPGNGIFNRPDLAYDSNARIIQLVARFQF